MFPIVPLPECMSEYASTHVTSAILAFMLFFIISVGAITSASRSYAQYQQEKDKYVIRVGFGILAVSFACLLLGLYIVGPIVVIGIVYLIYLFGQAFRDGFLK